ncbi:MAG: hypothetical protein KatS3mg076_2300 [Candidatus Binatia bacterium]|nr:MAG: hypothetical protein KatS3mg076_2300 [Candidatus Binatia bacterium]
MKRKVFGFFVSLALAASATPASAWWFDFSWLQRLAPSPTPTSGAGVSAPTVTRTPTRVPSFTPTPTATRTPPTGAVASSGSPAQKLPAALLVYPYVRAGTQDGTTYDTRIEILNMTSAPVSLQCFYLRAEDWFETGFFVTLTAGQPLSWLASTGARNVITFTAVPPFQGEGELKCGVLPATPDLESHNAVQGRAIVFDDQGQVAGYSAISFRRLVPGEFTGTFELDGITYEMCPRTLHFDVLAAKPGSQSEIVLVPCTQDFLEQRPTTVTASLLVTNEFEQTFSGSRSVECWTRLPFGQFSSTLNKSTLGTDTAHLAVRGVQSSLLGLVLDKFEAFGNPATAANEPFLSGGRPGVVTFP